MDALGKVVSFFIFSGAIYFLAVLIAILWIIYNFVKAPKESIIMTLSFASSALIVAVIIFSTKKLWLDFETKLETSILGLLVSLALLVTLIYFTNIYFARRLK